MVCFPLLWALAPPVPLLELLILICASYFILSVWFSFSSLRITRKTLFTSPVTFGRVFWWEHFNQTARDDFEWRSVSLQSFTMVVQRPSLRGSGGRGRNSTCPLQCPAPKALSVRTHPYTLTWVHSHKYTRIHSRMALCKFWPSVWIIYVSCILSSIQVQPSDTVMWREDGWSRTCTTAPHLRLWSSILLYVIPLINAVQNMSARVPKLYLSVESLPGFTP